MRTKELKEKELHNLQEIILEKTGVSLTKPILRQAFARSSFSNRYNNENFEFIGDTVIGNYVVKKLYEQFKRYIFNEDYYAYYSFDENCLSSLKNTIVSNENLARIIDQWDVAKYLVVGTSDANNSIDSQIKIKADLFEAIIGAITIYLNWKQDNLEKVFNKVLPVDEYISNYKKEECRQEIFTMENAISTLKELYEKGKIEELKYRYLSPDNLGYTKDGNPKWSCTCSIVDEVTGYIITVFANSKKDAKKCAAYLVLCAKYNKPNEYGPNDTLFACWEYDKKNNKLYHSK